MGCPLPVGCRSECHLSYLTFFYSFSQLGGSMFPAQRAHGCQLPVMSPLQGSPSMAASYPTWHLCKAVCPWLLRTQGVTSQDDRSTTATYPRQSCRLVLRGGAHGARCQEGLQDMGNSTVNEPQELKMGWQACQSEGYAFCSDIIPHLFFFLKYQKNKALQKCQAVRRKVESQKIQS